MRLSLFERKAGRDCAPSAFEVCTNDLVGRHIIGSLLESVRRHASINAFNLSVAVLAAELTEHRRYYYLVIEVVVVAAGKLVGATTVLAFHRCSEVVAVPVKNFAYLHFYTYFFLPVDRTVRDLLLSAPKLDLSRSLELRISVR